MAKYVILLLLLSNVALAKPEIEVSGFGTVGLVLNSSKEFGYRSDFSKEGGVFEGDFDFAEKSNLGIQVDIIANAEIDIVMQAVYRDQKKLNFDNAVNLLFVRYSPNANWSFRIGRTAFDLFLLTEYRDIGYAYQWAHVPTEVYGVIPHRYLDGADMTYSRPIGNQTFSAKIFHGQNQANVNAFNGTDSVSANFDNIIGVALDLHGLNWDLALNHTRLKFDSQDFALIIEAVTAYTSFVPNFDLIWPDALPLVIEADLDNRDAVYTSISGRYLFESITLISELATSSSDTLSVQSVKTGYVSAIYHANAHNFFATIAVSRSDSFDINSLTVNRDALAQVPGGTEVYDATSLAINYYKSNQRTMSIGWRWDFAENMSFTLQVDHTEITSGGSTFWQPPQMDDVTTGRTGSVNSLFANVSFLY